MLRRLVEHPVLIAAAVGCLPLFMDALGCSFDASGVATVSPDPLPSAYLCSCTCGAPGSANDPGPLPPSDDATEAGSGTVSPDEARLRMEPGRLVGVRFANVQIPAGVVIQEAYIRFTAADNQSEPIDVSIAAEDSGDAAPITAADSDLSGRPRTAAAVAWNGIPAWIQGASGDAERTPNLKDVVQAVVSGGGWSQGNALLILLDHVGGPGTRRAESLEGIPGREAVLEVSYVDPLESATLDLRVCMPADENPNFNEKGDDNSLSDGEIADLEDAVLADCMGRVQSSVTGIGSMCKYTDGCSCTVTDTTLIADDSCNADMGLCQGEALEIVDGECTNFDPEAPAKSISATHVAGQDPVCLVAGADPPIPVPDPLGGGLFGRRSRCEADGVAEVVVADKSPRTPGASSVIFLNGDPCPGASCDVGVAYQAQVDPFSFDGGFLGEGDTTISEVIVSGASLPSAVPLAVSGSGVLGSEETFSTGRGRRKTNRVLRPDTVKRETFVGTNGMPVNVLVDWQNAMCGLDGTLVGGVTVGDDDPDEGEEPVESDLTVAVDLAGVIVNQPPFADAGDDRSVECTSPAGAPVLLDGTGSSDFDGNLKFVRWMQGSPTGDDVGFGLQTRTALDLDQSETYFLRVVDAYGQASTDEVEVAVVDTTPPLLTPPADVTAECVAPEGTPVALGMPFTADVCDPAPMVVNDAPALFPLGTTVVTWTATDASGNSFQATQTVVVEDTTPPEISLALSPTSLWPPNHKLATVSATIVATDICDPDPAVELVSVDSSEPDDALADGATPDDIQGADLGTDDRAIELRAERQGSGVGRVYTVVYRAVDDSGNSTPAEDEVAVSRSRGM